MSVTIMFRGTTVGPVCRHLAKIAQDEFGVTFKVQDQNDPFTRTSNELMLVRWGSAKDGYAERTINTARAVALCNDKRASRRALRGICPTTWDKDNMENMQFPVIVRPRKHYGGKSFYVAKNFAEFQPLRRQLRLKGWYASKIIEKAAEYRVFVLQGRIIAVTQKFPSDASALAWNLHQGGSTQIVKRKNWDPKLLTVALEAAKRLGLDWAAVDLYVSKTGEVGVFECNTAPGLTTERALRRLARALIWAEKNAAPAPSPATITGWKDVLHPALLAVDDEDRVVAQPAPTPQAPAPAPQPTPVAPAVAAAPAPAPVVAPPPPPPVVQAPVPPPQQLLQEYGILVRVKVTAASKRAAQEKVRNALDLFVGSTVID